MSYFQSNDLNAGRGSDDLTISARWVVARYRRISSLQGYMELACLGNAAQIKSMMVHMEELELKC